VLKIISQFTINFSNSAPSYTSTRIYNPLYSFHIFNTHDLVHHSLHFQSNTINLLRKILHCLYSKETTFIHLNPPVFENPPQPSDNLKGNSTFITSGSQMICFI